MPNQAPTKTLLWPDLTPYGMSLSIVFNPSLNQNFLKLSVLNREKLIEAGLSKDTHFLTLMRSMGFSYFPGETHARAQVYSLSQKTLVDEENLNRIKSQLYFYNPNLNVSLDWLRRLVPNLTVADLKHCPLSSIKELDYAYLEQRDIDLLREEVGLPDKYWVVSGATIDINGVKNWGDPDVASSQYLIDSRAFLAFSEEGVKALSTNSLVLAFNDGDVAEALYPGRVEEVSLPYAAPFAQCYLTGALVMIKDCRFLPVSQNEIYNLRPLQKRLDTYQQIGILFDKLRTLEEYRKTDPTTDQLSHAKRLVEEVDQQLERFAEIVGEPVFVNCLYDVIGTGKKYFDRFILNHQADLVAIIDNYAGIRQSILDQYASWQADVIRQKELNRVSQGIQTMSTGGDKRQDAGEKIGGARKDYAARSLSSSELGSLSPRELVDVVSRDHIWPVLDFNKMRADGVSPAVAYSIKVIRAGIPVNLYRAGYNAAKRFLDRRALTEFSVEDYKNYVDAVSFVRDCFLDVRTEKQLQDALHTIHEKFLDERSSRVWREADPFCASLGYNFYRKVLPPFFRKEDGTIDAYYFNNFLQVARVKTGNDWIWTEPKTKRKSNGQTPPEPVRPGLANIQRTGPDYRLSKNIDEMTLMNTFGFRAVEYGNWLPQDERQSVLNHAYDAFMDLSRVTSLPPSCMGLGGRLAIAFGARGIGGRRAASAHFEPGRFVMNLTRLTGAGAVAHEWAHAFDYFLANSAGASNIEALTRLLTNENRVSPKKICAENYRALLNNFERLVNSLLTYQRSQLDVVDDLVHLDVRGEKITVKNFVLNTVLGYVVHMDSNLPESKRNGAFLDFASTHVKENLVDAEFTDGKLACFSSVDSLFQNLVLAFKCQPGADQTLGFIEYKRSLDNLAELCSRRAKLVTRVMTEPDSIDRSADSKFLTDSKYFDSGRSKKYYCTTIEMFARAFETWAEHRVKLDGSTSDYLVHGTLNEGLTRSAYPMGQDLERIVVHFDEFFESNKPLLTNSMSASIKANVESVPVMNQ